MSLGDNNLMNMPRRLRFRELRRQNRARRRLINNTAAMIEWWTRVEHSCYLPLHSRRLITTTSQEDVKGE